MMSDPPKPPGQPPDEPDPDDPVPIEDPPAPIPVPRDPPPEPLRATSERHLNMTGRVCNHAANRGSTRLCADRRDSER